MPNFRPITRDSHGTKFWKPQSSFHFAAKEAAVPLTFDELPRAVVSLVVGFMLNADDYFPVALLGLKPGENLLVGANGQWLGRYVPALFRAHPFGIGPVASDREILCIDEDSGLVSDGPIGERFFDQSGAATKTIEGVLSFLQTVSAGQRQTKRICQVLKMHNLIQPWPIAIDSPAGEQRLGGIYRIDEAALNALPGEAFLELRTAGALLVAYLQLLSMQHLQALGLVADAKAKAVAQALPVNANGELDLEFMNDGPLLDFNRFK